MTKKTIPTNTDSVEHPKNLLLLIDKAEFPCSKIDLVNIAAESGGTEESLEAFRALPKAEYSTIYEVNTDLGLINKLPGQENLFSSRPPRKYS